MRTPDCIPVGSLPAKTKNLKCAGCRGPRGGEVESEAVRTPGHQMMSMLSPVAIFKGKGHVCGSRLGVRAERPSSSGPSRCLSGRGCWSLERLALPRPLPFCQPPDPGTPSSRTSLGPHLPVGHPLLCLISAQILFHIWSTCQAQHCPEEPPLPGFCGQGTLEQSFPTEHYVRMEILYNLCCPIRP